MSKLSEPKYTVIPLHESFRNKSYAEWVQDWSNWFYQPYPERNNDGDVVFLRSMPLAEGNYQNEAMVMVGNESLEITEDQLVLVPIITSTYIADNSELPEWMYGMVRSNISGGDDPPTVGQLKINGEPIKLFNKDNKRENDFGEYQLETPVYMITIPDSSPGQSLKDQVEMPLQSSGLFPAVTRGYFVMLKLEEGSTYDIECTATGATTARGPYHVSLFYRLIVDKPKEKKEAKKAPERLTRNIEIRVRDKFIKGQLPFDEFKVIMGHLGIKIEDINSISGIDKSQFKETRIQKNKNN